MSMLPLLVMALMQWWSEGDPRAICVHRRPNSQYPRHRPTPAWDVAIQPPGRRRCRCTAQRSRHGGRYRSISTPALALLAALAPAEGITGAACMGLAPLHDSDVRRETSDDREVRHDRARATQYPAPTTGYEVLRYVHNRLPGTQRVRSSSVRCQIYPTVPTVNLQVECTTSTLTNHVNFRKRREGRVRFPSASANTSRVQK